jgi:predicted nucleic acid-binding protein
MAAFLDTNVLNDKEFMVAVRKAVHSGRLSVVTSPIVILEYGFYQRLHGKLQKFQRLIQELQMGIVSISGKDALIAVKHSMEYKEDPRGPYYFFRDALIAATSERLKIPLVTNNVENFKGLPAKMKMTSQEAVKIFSET